jgi:hypothetical protein
VGDAAVCDTTATSQGELLQGGEVSQVGDAAVFVLTAQIQVEVLQ